MVFKSKVRKVKKHESVKEAEKPHHGKKKNSAKTQRSIPSTEITPLKSVQTISNDLNIYKLLEFHLNKKKELTVLSDNFNLLFYGYGEKSKLLKKLFPRISSINCNNKTDLDLLQELFEILTEEEIPKSNALQAIQTLKEYCTSRDKYKIVLFNPPESFITLIQPIKGLTILSTQDTYQLKYTETYLVKNNFLLVDLTTFIPYEEAEEGVEEFDKSVAFDILKIVANVPKRSVNVFKEILKLCGNSDYKRKGFIVQAVPFFELIKEQLLITDFNVINQHLIEFFEHRILQRVDGGFKCYFTAQDARDVLNELK